MKLDIVLEARLAHKWVHFDRIVFVDGKEYVHRSESDVYTNPLYPSFYSHVAPEYILCADKKTDRYKKNGYLNSIVENLDLEEFTKENRLNLFYYSGMHFGKYMMKKGFEINSVRFLNAPYICPKSGVVWQYREDKKEYSDRPWKFKRMPNDNSLIVTTREQEYLACTFLKGTPVNKPFIHSVKTSFLSGPDAIYEHSRIGNLNGQYYDKNTGDYEDARDFLIKKQPKKINKREKSWLKIKKSCLKRGISVPK